MLTISLEKICFLIIKAREFDAKMEPEVSDPGDNPIDDEDREVLFDYPDDPTVEEIRGLIENLNEDEIAEVLALIWVGEGEYDADEWSEALADARLDTESQQVEALLSIPLLGDFLEDGLAELGYSCNEIDRQHL
jgi:Protein of unknown function (DUF3775).